MTKHYAMLDENYICRSIIGTDFLETNEFCVEVEGDGLEFLRMKYESGMWVEAPSEMEIEPPLSHMEQAVLRTEINTEYMTTLLEMTI